LTLLEVKLGIKCFIHKSGIIAAFFRILPESFVVIWFFELRGTQRWRKYL